ncbi:MAG TPA: hypothetical protein VE623_02170 [Acidimicrobiales bacterium]|nr:hypothetical protein [Acidimicrobiales bacterium]
MPLAWRTRTAEVYLLVRRQFPEVARALDDLARVTEGAGPLPARE